MNRVEDGRSQRKMLNWHHNGRNEKRGIDYRLERQKNPKLVLKNLAAQTGLTFTEEKRKMRILFVERTKPFKRCPCPGPATLTYTVAQ